MNLIPLKKMLYKSNGIMYIISTGIEDEGTIRQFFSPCTMLLRLDGIKYGVLQSLMQIVQQHSLFLSENNNNKNYT